MYSAVPATFAVIDDDAGIPEPADLIHVAALRWPESILQLGTGFSSSKVILAAVECGVFT
jgi:hypothetical protein